MTREVELLVNKAQRAIAKGKNDLAKKCYLKALTLRPNMPNLHYGLATVCYLENDLETAADHFTEVTRLDPLRAGAFINLGAVYNKLGQLDNAIGALRKGIQLDLNRPEGYYNLGLVYRRKGHLELAIQAYREATRVEPRMADAHYNLANLYLEKGQYNLAAVHYEKCLELRPDWEKALGGLEQARQSLEDALEESDDAETFDSDDGSEAPTQRMVDPDRVVDPYDHGAILTELHRYTKESEKLGKEFVTLLQKQIEPAIKVLSNCLLQTNQSPIELDQCVQKVESAVSSMNSTQKDLQSSMQRIREFGDRLMQH